MAAINYEALGLSGPKKMVDKNPALGAAFAKMLADMGANPDTLDKSKAATLFTIVTNVPDDRAAGRALIGRFVVEDKLRTKAQVEEAVKYVKAQPASAAITDEAFGAACGAGVSFTDEEVKAKARPCLTFLAHVIRGTD